MGSGLCLMRGQVRMGVGPKLQKPPAQAPLVQPGLHLKSEERQCSEGGVSGCSQQQFKYTHPWAFSLREPALLDKLGGSRRLWQANPGDGPKGMLRPRPLEQVTVLPLMVFWSQ